MRQGSRQDNFDLIHQLNQRYRTEFVRAEALQAELEDIRGSRLWPWFQWLRQIRRFFSPKESAPPLPAESGSESWNLGFTPCSELNFDTSQISIIIPFRDQYELLIRCVQPLRRATPEAEMILVNNGSVDPGVTRFLSRWSRQVRSLVVHLPEPFNFSRLCNAGAALAHGEVLLFLNNDVLAIQPGWLEAMLDVLADARVGIVGATLLFPDRTIQHVGMAPVGTEQAWVHLYRSYPEAHLGENGELSRIRTVPAVTGACLMIRRHVFESHDGFDERLAVTMNDVDLCQRVQQKGLLVAITPFARLWHFESLSRGYQLEVG